MQLWPHYLSCFFLLFVSADSVVLRLYLEDSLRKAVEPSAHCGQLEHLEMGVFICSGQVACGKEGQRRRAHFVMLTTGSI